MGKGAYDRQIQQAIRQVCLGSDVGIVPVLRGVRHDEDEGLRLEGALTVVDVEAIGLGLEGAVLLDHGAQVGHGATCGGLGEGPTDGSVEAIPQVQKKGRPLSSQLSIAIRRPLTSCWMT